jgi:hypothetical protein
MKRIEWAVVIGFFGAIGVSACGGNDDVGSGTGGSGNQADGSPSDASSEAPALDAASDSSGSTPCTGTSACPMTDATSCEQVSGCAWTPGVCTNVSRNSTIACGDHPPANGSICPPGCTISSTGTCVGSTGGDYYDAPLDCASGVRQSHDTCIGPGDIWFGKECAWAPPGCDGTPPMCETLTTKAECEIVGCTWQSS